MKQKSLLLRLGGLLVRTVYRLNVSGLNRLPEGGCLLLPNHVTWVDAVLLQAACPRPIRFLVYEPIYRNRWLNPIFRLMRAIPIASRKAKEAIRMAADEIRKGEIVCVFPEGEISRSGSLLRLRRGYEMIANAAEAPVVPVWLDQLWGSIFSYYGNKFFKKLPKKIPYPVTIQFGQPIPAKEADIATVRERLLILGEEAYQQRPLLKGNLAHACVRGLKHWQFAPAIIEGTDGSSLSRGMVLAVAIVLSKILKKESGNKRIGVLLPSGRGSVISNLAILLAGKVPVNLNFTAGRASVEAVIRIAGLTEVITAKPLLQQLGEDFPLPEKVLYIEELLPPLKKQIGLWRAAVAVLPWWGLTTLLGLSNHGDREEAALLFTSGSSGDPKGVVLSHRNILGNVSQFAQMLNLTRNDSILASLPCFHSFGFTVTIWFPLLEGIRIVTYPSPIDSEKNAELIEKYGITLVLATPTFLRGYLRKSTKEQWKTVKLLVTGAEKLPLDVAEAFHEKMGIPVMEGYGLTETSPVVSVNLPEPPRRSPSDEIQPSARLGSVGKLAPGMAAQVRDPETDEPLSLHDTGMLWFKGPNIFEGYFEAADQTAAVIRNGWFKSGDLGRFDEDGFLYIEGRLSRFSKIGGEMVPHETVESKIYAAMGLAGVDQRIFCVTGIPDAAKGEALVLLSTQEVDLPALRSQLLAEGVPALWIPKVVRVVPAIPVLGSGKLDLRACRELAMEMALQK